MKTLITAHHVEHPHHGCIVTRPLGGYFELVSDDGYWTPDVHLLEEGPTEWPCATELGAIKLGRELVEEGKAEA